MREYDVIVKTIRNQGCVTMADVRKLCELGIPAVNICVEVVDVENFLRQLDDFINV
jgi:hypothetical protein